jgi:hypothetical protein
MKLLNIRIDPALEEKIRLQSEQKNIKFSCHIRFLLEKALARE